MHTCETSTRNNHTTLQFQTRAQLAFKENAPKITTTAGHSCLQHSVTSRALTNVQSLQPGPPHTATSRQAAMSPQPATVTTPQTTPQATRQCSHLQQQASPPAAMATAASCRCSCWRLPPQHRPALTPCLAGCSLHQTSPASYGVLMRHLSNRAQRPGQPLPASARRQLAAAALKLYGTRVSTSACMQ